VDAGAYVSGCVGFATSAPDVELAWSGTSNALTIFFLADDPSQDTTLIINAPDGSWYCDDDSYPDSARDPLFSFEAPREGVYDIWVGSYQAGSFVSGSLYISEYAP
jgi:serine protease Do